MKRILSLILSLTLLLIAASACAEAGSLEKLSCPELGFSTLIPAGLSTKLDMDERSVTIFLWEEGSVPNIWIHPRDSKLNNPVSFMHEVYPDFMQEKYGENLMMVNKYEYYDIAGMKLNAVGFVYKDKNGNVIYQLNMVLLGEKNDVEFQARYIGSGEDEALAALETIIGNYRPDDGTSGSSQKSGFSGKSTGSGTPESSGKSTAAPQTTGSAGKHSFVVTDVRQDNMIVGRCVAPADYTVSSQASCCTRAQSFEYPWFLLIGAESPEGIAMLYCSPQSFYDNGSGTSQDGGYYSQFMMPTMHYMSASDYCDYFVTGMNPSASQIRLVEDNSFPELQAALNQAAENYKNAANQAARGTGITVARVDQTMSMRVYYVEPGSGAPYYFAVATSTLGVWNELYGVFGAVNSYTVWRTDYVYAMICPASLWEANRDVFNVFIANTSVTDQFRAANQRLSTDLQSILTGIDLSGGSDYSKKVMAQETAKGDDYNDEQFSDYMFDQNDYTLSDGTHVKVSTAYDYVWSGDNGNVYYSNDASAMPSGATRLYPNQ